MTEKMYEIRPTGTRMERLHKKKKKQSKGALLLVTAAFTAFCAYTGGVFYFLNHFYKDTVINDVDVSYMDAAEAYDKIKNNSLSYDIQILGRDNITDTINAENIGLKINENAENAIKKIKSGQSGFMWVSGFLKENSYSNYDILEVDEDKFNSSFENLKIVNNKNVTEPKEPYYKYNGSEYTLVEEVKGNYVIAENLKKNIKNGILSGKRTIDLKEGDSYKNPQFTKDLQEVKDAKDVVNKFKDIKLTYTFDDGNKEIDGSDIESWFSYNDNFQVSLDKNKIMQFVDDLSNEYGAAGGSRNFKTTDGRDIVISGGDYGNEIDKEAETAAIINMLNSKVSEEREPVYVNKESKTGKNGIGNTYVEVDLGNQHLWFYKDGQLVCESDIVSGNMIQGHGTPAGVYRLKAKQLNAVLVGEDYRTPVGYWMPFNGGIGIHDATWRSVFGGEIYYTGGSHGCVNAPYALAQTIYNNIEVGTPIVCYY